MNEGSDEGGGKGGVEAPRGRKRQEPTPTQRALGLLVRREHSRKELTRKLAARGVDPDAAMAAVDKLHAALVAALKSTEVAEQLSRQGFETQASTPEELKAYIAREMARWEKVINDNGIKVSL